MNQSNTSKLGIGIAVIIIAIIVGVLMVTSHQAPATPAVVDQTVPTQDLSVKGTSPEVSSQYFCINNICKWYYRASFNSIAVPNISSAQGTGIATSTGGSVCSIPVPRIGSTTLEMATMKVTNAATSTFFLQIATSTSPSATTSPLGGFSSITSSGSTTPQIHWTPPSTATSFGGYTGAQSGTTTFPSYLNFSYSSVAITPGTLNGVCQAVFTQDM